MIWTLACAQSDKDWKNQDGPLLAGRSDGAQSIEGLGRAVVEEAADTPTRAGHGCGRDLRYRRLPDVSDGPYVRRKELTSPPPIVVVMSVEMETSEVVVKYS
jgi:hypothetical protein